MTVEGISKNSDDMTGSKGYYKEALQAVLTLIKNFSGEELVKMTADIAYIVNIIFRVDRENEMNFSYM